MAKLSGRVSGWGLFALALLGGLAACDVFDRPVAIAHYDVRLCTNLGNALDAPQEGDWGFVIEERHFDVIRDAGFDTVRLPVRWSAHVQTESPYHIDPKFWARVDEVIAQAHARGLTVILNVHHYDELTENPAAERERFLALWAQLAEHYKTYDIRRLHFELLNEARDQLVGEDLNRLMDEAIAVVRETNPERVLIVGGDDWNSLEALSRVPRPRDRNVVGTFHYYLPFNFTHQGAEFLEEPPEEGLQWGTAEDRAALDNDARQAATERDRLRRPVLMGEFGVYTGVADPERLEWYRAVRVAMEAQGIGWCAWNFGSNFGLWDEERQDWRPGALEALGLNPASAEEG